MIPETPVNAGHAYANSGEEYEYLEEWTKAAEAHSQAAQQFQKAVELSQDAEATKTLRLLAQDHLKKAKELGRKIDLKKPQKQQQQMYSLPSASSVDNSRTSLCRAYDSDGENSQFDMESLRLALSADRRRGQHQRQHQQQHTGRPTHGWNSPAIGGSYAVLPPDDQDDETDPFNKFFNVVEKLVDKLSNPVAFASIPLYENDNPTPAWGSTGSKQMDGRDSDDDNDEETDTNMMESYFVVPGTTSSYPTAALERTPEHEKDDPMAENEQLKKRVKQLIHQVQALKAAEKERNMLKSSILQLHTDIQKQAKDIMHSTNPMHGTSTTMGSSNNVYSNNTVRPLDGDLVNRIKKLEDENRQLKAQNEQQQMLMKKYQERWEKLKESAKKRRAQPHQDSASTSKTNRSLSPSSAASNGSSTYTMCSSETVRGPTLLRTLAQQSPFPSFGVRRTSTASISDRGSFRD